MPIRVLCNQCQKSFRTADENAGKRTKCPACGAALTIPQPGEAQHAASSGEQTSGAGTSSAAGGGTLSGFGGSSAGSHAASSAGGDQWHLATPDGQQHGPITKTELDRWVAEGRVQSHFNIFCQGWTEWRPASTMYPQLLQQSGMGMQSPGGMDLSGVGAMGMSGAGMPMGMNPVGPMGGMSQADPMMGPFAMTGGMAASPYAAPMASGYMVQRKSDADVPGILAVTFGGLALLCTLFACLIQFIGIIALLFAISGLVLSFFAKPPMKTIGIVLNSLVLAACVVVVILALIAVVFGVAFLGAAANRGQGFGP